MFHNFDWSKTIQIYKGSWGLWEKTFFYVFTPDGSGLQAKKIFLIWLNVLSSNSVFAFIYLIFTRVKNKTFFDFPYHNNIHSCVDTMATTAPRRRCYCEMGYMGEGCSKRSPLSRKFREGELGEEGGYKSRKLVRGETKWWNILAFFKKNMAVFEQGFWQKA